jgi:hypothetical protein
MFNLQVALQAEVLLADQCSTGLQQHLRQPTCAVPAGGKHDNPCEALGLTPACAQVMAVRALADLVAQAAAGVQREAAAAALHGAQALVSLHGVYEVLLRTLRNRSIFCRCADAFRLSCMCSIPWASACQAEVPTDESIRKTCRVCSVRVEAASALGDMAALRPRGAADVNAEMPAIAASALVRFYRELRYDPDSGKHLPLHFSDLGEHAVALAVARASARARTPDGFSPDSSVDLLLGALANVDNRSVEFDATGAAPLRCAAASGPDCVRFAVLPNPGCASCRDPDRFHANDVCFALRCRCRAAIPA